MQTSAAHGQGTIAGYPSEAWLRQRRSPETSIFNNVKAWARIRFARCTLVPTGALKERQKLPLLAPEESVCHGGI